MENKINQISWGLIRENPGPPGPLASIWQWADVSTGEKGEFETLAVEQDASQLDVSTWTAEEVHQWREERAAIQWEGRPPEIRPNVDEDLGGPNPWDDTTRAAPIDDFAPWEDLPDPLDPHGTCSGLNCWWDGTGRQRCSDCDPPNKARLMRATVATQQRRAERRRQAAQRTEVAT